MIKLPLARSTFNKLESVLRSGPIPPRITELITIAENKPNEQVTKNMIEILQFTYYHQNQEKSMPSWLYDFATMRNKTVKEKHHFTNIYGSLIKFKHLTESMDVEELGKNVFERYNTIWDKTYHLHFKRMHNFQQNKRTKVMDIDEFDRFPINEETLKLTKKLETLTKEYSHELNNKVSPPELVLKIVPLPNGHPPVMKVVYNQLLSRLRKLQEYVLKYPLIAQEDMEALNQIDLVELDGTVREAYVKFLSEVFTINEDGKIAKSDLLKNRLAKSVEIEKLYMETNQKN